MDDQDPELSDDNEMINEEDEEQDQIVIQQNETSESKKLIRNSIHFRVPTYDKLDEKSVESQI